MTSVLMTLVIGLPVSAIWVVCASFMLREGYRSGYSDGRFNAKHPEIARPPRFDLKESR